MKRLGLGLCLAVMLCNVAPLAAQGEAPERTKIPIELYGQVFSTEPIRVPGATLSYDQVKDYLPLVLVSMHDPNSERDIFDILDYLNQVLRAYENMYNAAVPILATRLHHFMPERDLTEIQHEVADYIRAGQWQALSKKYESYSKSLPPQIMDMQKAHNKYLALLYAVEMVSYSTEAEAAFEISPEEQHSHDFVPGANPGKKYQYGFGYDRIHIHDYTVQDGNPKFPWEEKGYVEPE